MTPPAPAARSQGLQCLRAIAALSVVLYHASTYLKEYRHEPAMTEIFTPFFGFFGVGLFFAISGALMARVSQGIRPDLFLAHRIARIYPPFWLLSALVIFVMSFKFPGLWPEAGNIPLVPGGQTQEFLHIEWTLPYELTYYFVIFLVVLVRAPRFLPFLALLWLAAIGLTTEYQPLWQYKMTPPVSFLLVSERGLPFVFGLLVPAALPFAWLRPLLTAAALAILGWIGWAGLIEHWMVNNWLLGLACACLVAAASGWQGAARLRAGRALARLGDWSYALYLVHVPVIMALDEKLPAAWPPALMWLLFLGTPLLAARVIGPADVWLYRRLKSAADAAPGPVLWAVALLFSGVFLGLGISRALR